MHDKPCKLHGTIILVKGCRYDGTAVASEVYPDFAKVVPAPGTRLALRSETLITMGPACGPNLTLSASATSDPVRFRSPIDRDSGQ
jgi:hypothetical protein